MKKGTVYIETLGCQMNVADTERAMTQLRQAGYCMTDSAVTADVLIFNTCSIRERAAHKVFTRIGEVRKARRGRPSPLLGLMGCVAQLEGEALFDQIAGLNFIVGTRATDRLPSLIERLESVEMRAFDLGERAAGEVWNVSPVERRSAHVAFVPIIEGCNKFCSYCIVPFSRGREKSRLATEILCEIKALREQGYREVHLIGQNVNSYRPVSMEGLEGHSGATPFARLLRAVAATKFERIKFTTSFPRDFHADILVAIDEHENLCNWVHLPVQSGSDKILRSMRRGHTVADYLKRVERLKQARRSISLTSDIIIGFPGETAADFAATVELVKRCQYDGLYIFKYSKRPGTPSEKLPDTVSDEEKSARFALLEEVQKQSQQKIYHSYVGRQLEVLVEGKSAKSKEDLTGHSTCHKVVNFSGDADLIGRVVKVGVIEAKANSLYGKQLAQQS